MILRATLATVGRFHVFALAEQLARRDALVAIYTGHARPFVRAPALDARMVRTFPWVQTPFEGLQRLGLMPRALERQMSWIAKQTLDRHVARTLPDCQVYYALSGVGLHSGSVAQARGAAYVCDRSSSHILVQDRLLREEHARLGLAFAGIDPRIVEKERQEYAQADAILVPSTFARRSFIEAGVPPDKVHCLPLGVDLRDFRPPFASPGPGFRILFVGALSVRKGLHHLLDAMRRARLADATLVLVGAAQPETRSLLARFPAANVEITGPLSRAETARQMGRAHVFVLPSVEDGFGLVMAEAMACGCPVVASANTGAADLFTDGREGFIVPARDADAIADRLMRLRDDPALRAAMAQAALDRVRSLGGWDAYGREAVALFAALARARGHEVTVADSAS